MSAPVDLASRLRDALGVPVEWHSTLTSTNERCRELGRAAGAVDGTIVVAEEQSAGRGRRGRVWYSPGGAGVYASVLIGGGRWLREPALAQLAAGVAVADAVSRFTSETVELVWPNDCYVRGRKLAGVLAEAETTSGALQFMVCGIGINLDFRGAPLPEGLGATAIDLATVAQAAIDRVTLTIDLFERLQRLRRDSEEAGGAAILQRWRQRAPMVQGAQVEVDTPGGRLQGLTDGLADDGALMLRANGDVYRLLVGEVVRLRRRT